MSLGLLESVCFEGMGNSYWKPKFPETSAQDNPGNFGGAAWDIFHYSEVAAQKSIAAYN